MTSQEMDVVIVGGGPGGYVAAIRAAQLGLKVVLVEKEHLGGVCLNWGCIPTKSLLRNAEVIGLLAEGKAFGFTLEGFQADYGAAVDRSRKVSQRLVQGVAALMRKNGIQVVDGTGRIAAAGTVEVSGNAGEKLTLKARSIVVATGARARSLPGLQVDGERILTARHALEMRTLPKSAIVVGAGPIGMEFAHVWHTYGAEVTVVEMMSRLLPLEDEEISKEVERAYKKRRLRILTSTRVESVEPGSDAVQVRVRPEAGEVQNLQAEKVLVAIGVQPNSEDLGLEAAGARLGDRGCTNADERTRHMGHRRRHRQDAARTRSVCPGARGGRGHRRSRATPPGLQRHARLHLLPAPGRQLWLERGQGAPTGIPGPSGSVPIPGHRQGSGLGRLRWFCQAGGRRTVRLASGRPPGGTGGDGAAARVGPGAQR